MGSSYQSVSGSFQCSMTCKVLVLTRDLVINCRGCQHPFLLRSLRVVWGFYGLDWRAAGDWKQVWGWRELSFVFRYMCCFVLHWEDSDELSDHLDDDDDTDENGRCLHDGKDGDGDYHVSKFACTGWWWTEMILIRLCSLWLTRGERCRGDSWMTSTTTLLVPRLRPSFARLSSKFSLIHRSAAKIHFRICSTISCFPQNCEQAKLCQALEKVVWAIALQESLRCTIERSI